MSFYEDLAADAAAVLAEFGAPMTLTRTAVGQYDPATGTTTAGKPKTFPAVGVRLAYSLKDVDGTSIRETDQRIYLSAINVPQPQQDDTLMIGDEVLLVVSVRPLKPATKAVLYDVQARA